MSGASFKLAFVGEPGVGKSTCIAAISDIDVVSTDVGCTDELLRLKATTTVAFDYGELALDDQRKLLLYGLPGQARFAFMLDVVRDGLVGTVLLVDGSDEASIAGLEECLAWCEPVLRSVPFVVALNKTARDPARMAERCLALLRERNLVAPICRVDARVRADVVRIVEILFSIVGLSLRTTSEGVLT